ncbi:RHS repeat-associated core domain-containing protein [Streptomyces sp. NBC_01508]|uniref:RHS repeat-associated core domain-containing protein n=1 Tax=Streptomyces sp. NBC_01508 TaxID=2903888 RepID=UPI003862E2C7
MSLRGRPLAARMPRHTVGAVVLGVLLALSASTVQALPAEPGTAKPPGVQEDADPATGKNATTEPRPADPVAKAAVKRLGAAELPVRDVATVAVADGTPVKVGGLPVTLADVPTGSGASAKSGRGAATTSPAEARVEVLDQDRAGRLGAAAVVRIKPTDAPTGPSTVRIAVDYSAFDEAYGGSYGSRLRLVELPECAATHDLGTDECDGRPKVLQSVNDSDAKSLRATVTLADPATAEPVKSTATAPGARMAEADAAGSTVLALQAGDSSDKGDYKATSLSPSASWSVAKSSGGFSWDYPLRAVPTPGGLTPTVGLGYSSQSADGRTSATNNQGSWIGEGFSYEPGYIERSYKPCADDGHKESAEQCWAYDNATVMLNGAASQLIKDDTTGKWHFAAENGSKIEQLTNTDRTTGNGDNNGEHWKITTADGTEYSFGLNRLPGWTSGQEETRSTWTAPVFGDDSGEPCYQATFTSAHCKQGWRWNLDHVKDTHGNVLSYFYGAETNRYALNGKTDVNGTEYDRGGYLKRIDYGQRDGQVYAAKAPARMVFDTSERCLKTADFDCAESKFTDANAKYWPDTPVDRHCKSATKCAASQSTATFWTTKRLTGITTQMRSGADTYTDVDAWTLTHTFTDNGDDTKTLWLSKIDHEGRVDGSVKLPSLELQGIHLTNRVDSDDDNIDAFHRFRLQRVLSETGAQLDVTYAPTECTAGALPKPGESTKRCYPVVWAPPGSIDPKTDWFHKHVVKQITETDRTGMGDDLVTRYDYQGPAGWRHAEPDGITDEKYLTWGQWQGYGQVGVVSGNGQTMKSRVDYTFLQGLDGDKKAGGGTRTEQVTDSSGTAYTGHKEYTGFQIEAQTFDKGRVIARAITEPWKHDTATQTKSWATTRATLVKAKTTRGYSLLSTGAWRATKSVQHFDTDTPTGRVVRTEDFADLATAADDSCSRLWYADNPTENIYELPSRSEAVSVDCSATPDRKTQVLADERTSYDSGAWGAAPTKGDATRTERLTSHNGTTGTYQVTGTTTYDAFGRATAQGDTAGTKTTTEYVDVNGLISQTKVTNALGHVTTTDFAPAWGMSSGQTDPNGKRTDLAYDALGRLTSVWLPDQPKRTIPSIKYSYAVSRDKPVAIKTEKIEIGGTYGVEYQLYDGLLRPRQKQTEGPEGTRLVGDVFYDGTGKPKATNETYNAQGAPSAELLTVANGEVGAQSVFAYDDLGRTTAEIFQVAGVEQWRTTTVYDGELTHVDPPTGQVPVTTVKDGQGRTAELRHYRTNTPLPAGPGAQYDTTKYTYDHASRLKTVTDAKGNSWGYTYDQLGRVIENVDPDAGKSTTAYDALDRPVATTDGRGKKISTVYDKLDRPLTTWEGEPTTGTKLTETRYDKAGWLGQAYAALRYTSATEYFASVVQSMDAFYRPLQTAYSVPASEGVLKGIYTFSTSYNRDGTVQGNGMPAAGGLPAESTDIRYDELQRPTTLTGATTYASASYGPTSRLKQLTLGADQRAWQTFFHEKGTERLTTSVVDIEGMTGPAKRSDYSYDQAGNVLSISDTAGPSPDTQCFSYDTSQRLAEAWTPAATGTAAEGSGTVGGQLGGKTPTACSAAPGEQPLGGPAAYWKSYSVDAIGNRTKEVIHDTGLNAAKDTTRTYTYGEGPAGPHALTKVVDNTPTGDRQSTFTYDAAGNTTERTVGGDTQRLRWNDSGELISTAEADGKETTYLYDASGNRVVRRDASATTVYLPGMELSLPKGGTKVEATRYYSLAGQTVAVREDGGGLSYLTADHQGTSGLAIDATTGAVSQRRFDPFGAERGEAGGTWPGEKGFVGGTIDAQSGLTHLGAREYDPALGKFMSVDPVIDYTQPEQMNAYAYAHNSPVTQSDPTGLAPDDCAMTGVTCKPNGDGSWVVGGITPQGSAEKAVASAEEQQSQAKQRVVQSATALVKIVRALIGVDAALDCFSSGDIGACGETLLNIAGSFAGGLAGKVLAKYGVPWKWADGARLAKRIVGLVGDLIGGVKDYFKTSKAVDKAKSALATAREKAKAAAGKGKSADGPGCATGKEHSFLPGTDVLLADGTTKPIEDVELGDRITVTDPETGGTTTREVVGTIVTEDDKHFVDLTITTKTGKTGKTGKAGELSAALVSTTTHPFWVESEREWIEAGDLKPGMTLRTPDGDTATVEATRDFDQRQRTHDLTVSDIHTYYVLAGATPVLVHNCSGGTTVYRGVSEVSGETGSPNPGFDDAVEGIARPRGGDSTPEMHHLGMTDSDYTSWTTSPAAAIRAATKGGGNGVVIRATVPSARRHVHVNDQPWAERDLRGEAEVIIQGVMRGEARAAWPGARLEDLGFG